jgi:ABC-2 type transport system ATP-binding protein
MDLPDRDIPSAPAGLPDVGTETMLCVRGLSKTYGDGHRALEQVDLDMRRGEIFALLGPNGAGKTTLISIVCGLVRPGAGEVRVDGFDIESDYRETRSRIGLVPQELHTDMFETVLDTVRFSRGLFGCGPDEAYLEQLLRDLSLWDKRDNRIMTLSGGMKRRVLIAKALSHEPELLFLDEPTAGVDVELRREMWALVRRLRERGVSILLTTHYIEEAEEMADRIGIIHQGRLILVDDKQALIRKLGRKQLTLHLDQPLPSVPEALTQWGLDLDESGTVMEYHFDANDEQARVPQLLRELARAGVEFSDLNTRQSSLEEIFIRLLEENR